MSEDQTTIWFPAKRYGWGWGFPVTWQGWIVVLAYLLLLVGGLFVFLPNQRLFFGAFFVVLTVGLTRICWLKGEKPRWRWGQE